MAPRCVLGSVLLATLSYAETVLAQVPPPGPPATMLGAGQSVAMTTEEQLSIERTIVSDPRVRAIVSEAQPRIITAADELDKSEAEAFLEGRTTTPPTRRVTIVVINPQSQQAARVLFELPDNRILAVESIPASDVPFSRNDADEALALAVANPNLRRLVGDNLNRFQILESGSEARVPFAAQALPVRSTDPRDVCSTDRCVDFIFRTEDGYLPFRAHVNLARRTVEIHGGAGGQHR
jgi:hypothetical protein